MKYIIVTILAILIVQAMIANCLYGSVAMRYQRKLNKIKMEKLKEMRYLSKLYNVVK